MPAKKKASQAARRINKSSTPEEVYNRLLAVHERTSRRLDRLQTMYGFGDDEISAAEPVRPSVAVDNTDDPDMMRATFIVPRDLVWEMVSTFADYVQPQAA